MTATLELRRMTDDDAAAVHAFLQANEWPFHGTPQLTDSDLATMEFETDATHTFLIELGGELAGLIRLQDLDDLPEGNPLFDIRLGERARGQGHGATVVRLLTDHVFTEYPECHRFEAQTRQDNLAMQRTLERCGWTREGCYREAWPLPDGSRLDCVVYGILQREWAAQRAQAG